MSPILVTVLVLAGLYILLELKSSRPDGEELKVHPYRRIMGHIMPGRNECVVYFDAAIEADALLEYIEQANALFGAHATHCVLAAASVGMAENPSMNRFASGGRLYQRFEREVTFSMKRKQLDKKSKLAVVKMAMDDEETFRELCERINGRINVQRSSKKTRDDKEFDLLAAMPNFALRAAVVFLKGLDRRNLLPMSYIRTDGLYTSVFVANLGSLHMGPGYHHLYEWGNCSLFVMVGEIEERAVVRDGEIVVKKILPIRYTYDERIDDGLTARFGMDAVKRILENPFKELGCLAEDGSDAVKLKDRREVAG